MSTSFGGSFLDQVEEQVAIAVRARDRLGDGGKRSVGLALVLEAPLEDQHLDDLTLVGPGQNRAWWRQAFVEGSVEMFEGQAGAWALLHRRRLSWRRQAQVGIVSD